MVILGELSPYLADKLVKAAIGKPSKGVQHHKKIAACLKGIRHTA